MVRRTSGTRPSRYYPDDQSPWREHWLIQLTFFQEKRAGSQWCPSFPFRIGLRANDLPLDDDPLGPHHLEFNGTKITRRLAKCIAAINTPIQTARAPMASSSFGSVLKNPIWLAPGTTQLFMRKCLFGQFNPVTAASSF